MLTVVYILCAVIGVFLIINAVLVVTLHRLNRKLAKPRDLSPEESKDENSLIN